MNRLEIKQLHEELFAEYRRSAIRKRYIGSHPRLEGLEGYAWLSSVAHNRWCFLPMRTPFSVDAVVTVMAENLVHV